MGTAIALNGFKMQVLATEIGVENFARTKHIKGSKSATSSGEGASYQYSRTKSEQDTAAAYAVYTSHGTNLPAVAYTETGSVTQTPLLDF